MKTLYKNAKIYDSYKKSFFTGDLLVDGERISAVFWGGYDGKQSAYKTVDLEGDFIAPGLIDVHTHGRAGGDFISADENMLEKMSLSYMKSGVTGVFPTLASATPDEMRAAIDRIADAKAAGARNFAGVHLEGRYLNEARRGAHASHLLASLDSAELPSLIEKMQRVGHAHVSAALELDSDGSFAKTALELGATLGLAHSNATYAEACAAFGRGAHSLTHTFNAMSPFHHRDGGAVGAGLLDPKVYCELIVDGFHVAPEAVKLAYLLKKDKLVLISDSMEATGMPDGEYSIAGLPVTVKDGKARTHEGAIAGSTLDLIDGVKNLARFAGITFAEALYHATLAPAEMMGIEGKIGSVEQGKYANLLVLDKYMNIKQVIFGNRILVSDSI